MAPAENRAWSSRCSCCSCFWALGLLAGSTWLSPTWEQRVPESAAWCARELCLVLLCPFPFPPGLFQGLSPPTTGTRPRRQFLHPQLGKALRRKGRGTVTVAPSKPGCPHGRDRGKPWTPRPCSAACKNHRLQIWKAAQFPNTTTNWKTHLKMKPAPALGFKVSCIRPNLPDGCICTTKRFGFEAERSLFWKSKHKTSPSSMPAGRRLAWQLGAKAGQGPILFPGCFPS